MEGERVASLLQDLRQFRLASSSISPTARISVWNLLEHCACSVWGRNGYARRASARQRCAGVERVSEASSGYPRHVRRGDALVYAHVKIRRSEWPRVSGEAPPVCVCCA